MIQSVPLLLLPLLLPSFVSASFDCSFDIAPYHFDLSPLKGLHTAWKTVNTPPTVENSTVFLDLCENIIWDDNTYSPEDRCPDGTQGNLSRHSLWTVVCWIKYSQRGTEKSVLQFIPVAGTVSGNSLDPKTTVIPSSTSDQEVGGVRIELHGPDYLEARQKAIIELTCDTSVEVITCYAKQRWRLRLVRYTIALSMKVSFDWIGNQNMPVQDQRTQSLRMTIQIRNLKRNTGAS